MERNIHKITILMIFGFLILGAGISIDSLRNMSFPILPFMLFGLFMAAAGMSPHKPIDPFVEYNSTLHKLHGLFATLAGISITAGFIWQGIKLKNTGSKIICLYLAIICFAFPMLMLALNDYQGIIQRLMYLQVFIWMWVMFPDKIPADKRTHSTAYRR